MSDRELIAALNEEAPAHGLPLLTGNAAWLVVEVVRAEMRKCVNVPHSLLNADISIFPLSDWVRPIEIDGMRGFVLTSEADDAVFWAVWKHEARKLSNEGGDDE